MYVINEFVKSLCDSQSDFTFFSGPIFWIYFALSNLKYQFLKGFKVNNVPLSP